MRNAKIEIWTKPKFNHLAAKKDEVKNKTEKEKHQKGLNRKNWNVKIEIQPFRYLENKRLAN